MKWKYPNIPSPTRLTKRPLAHSISLLDDYYPSPLHASSFIGFYRLCLSFLLLFMLQTCLKNYLKHSQLIKTQIIETFKTDFLLCLTVWPIFTLWGYLSFFLEKLILCGLHENLALIFQHASQAGLFLMSVYLILSKNWCASHSTFVTMQACVHFMKMHSYTVTNRDYRNQLKSSKNDQCQALSKYPQNVTLYNFTIYMLMPVLVYEQKYPLRQRIRWGYVLRKVILIIVSLFACYLIFSEFIYPYIKMGNQISVIQLFLRCLVPCSLFILVSFYLVFENITNFFGQISMLADRTFYKDWWNSTTFEQFNRFNVLIGYGIVECMSFSTDICTCSVQ